MNNIILIPTLNPSDQLIKLTNELIELNLNKIIIIDDGSINKNIFNKLNKKIIVLHNDQNKGKGYSLKKGIREANKYFKNINGFITCDDDYQHLPKDILKINNYMNNDPNSLVLGVRNFKEKDVPRRSKIGNSFSSKFFKLKTGIYCPDTQTGLRGIPYSLKELSLNITGDRYEYEMNFLIEVTLMTPPVYIPIKTVYKNNNKESHFNPLKDSYLIYQKEINYILITIIDILLFTILINTLTNKLFNRVIIASFIARIISGIINFIFNKSKVKSSNKLIKYIILFIINMFISSYLVALLTIINLNIVFIKIVIDLLLFIINYKYFKMYDKI